MACPNVTKEEIAWHSQDALKVMHVVFFSRNGLLHDHPMPVGMTTHCQISAYSCSIRWGWLFIVHNQNSLNMVSFFSKTNDRIIAIMICKTGAERCWRILPAFQISPRMITGCLHMWKSIFGVKNLNHKMMSTLLSLPHIIWARMNTELQFNIYHIDGKSVWTVLVITLCRGHV
jgi:hypothetical protein